MSQQQSVQFDSVMPAGSASVGAWSRDVESRWTASISKGMTSEMTVKPTHAPPRSASIHIRSHSVSGINETPTLETHYELLKVLGEGGMGVIYSARQHSINRTIAVKMIKTEFCDDAESRDQFLAEAAVTGNLDHPNIVPIHDLGVNDDGAIFYSMKLVKGEPWEKILRTLTLRENLGILQRVSDAMAFAHSRNIVHRDLKPENVMLGEYGEVLLMDWGLAVTFNAEGKANHLTPEYACAGTPAYMAPEMALGMGEQIGPTSDIYLLGAILYEIISGQPPHIGNSILSCIRAAAKNEIVPVEQKGELIEIALKAMSALPEERFASVKDFQAALREYQAHCESIALNARAQESLARAAKSQDYRDYSRAMYTFEEAVVLWAENEGAVAGVHDARLGYATCALDKGDLDLAASLLETPKLRENLLLKKIQTAQIERSARQRRIKLLTYASASLAALVLLVVSVAFFLVSEEKQRVDEGRLVAVKAQARAEDERIMAEKNLADFKTEQTKVTTLESEKIRPWKTYYKSDFSLPREYGSVDERPTDLALGEWVLCDALPRDTSWTPDLNPKTLSKKLWTENNVLHFTTSKEAHIRLDMPLIGNLRLDVASKTEGETTLFFCGSKENHELDGYSFAIFNNKWKLQRKGKDVLKGIIESALPEKNSVLRIRMDRIGNQFQIFVGYGERTGELFAASDIPLFAWSDRLTFGGAGHDVCGLYVWKNEMTVSRFEAYRQGFAKRNTPMDFAAHLAEKGNFVSAIEEYKDCAFAMDTARERAPVMLEIAHLYALNNQPEKSEALLKRFVGEGKPLPSEFEVDYQADSALIARAAGELFLSDWDAEWDEFLKKETLLEMPQNKASWSKELQEAFDRYLRRVGTQRYAAFVFQGLVERMGLYWKYSRQRELLFTFIVQMIPDIYLREDRRVEAKKLLAREFLSGVSEVSDTSDAIRYYTRAIDLDPQNAQYYLERGNVRTSKNDSDGAISDFTKVIALDETKLTPVLEKITNHNKLNGLAKACFKSGKTKEAIEAQKKAISLIPKDYPAEQRKAYEAELKEYEAAP